ncbi:MAG: hypothetical protein HKN14_06630 [Marinicaulis sp.]|nr:hypothetical protein [Marinicaulis sp.]NNE40578.1 hypothetical protein [Marinicaulis sp.]NNL88192.1 hypothetical protein [Marinicaulis sp.]
MKLSIDGELHILRWRRGWFVDEVLFDDRRVATSQGLFAREAFFGFDINTGAGGSTKMVLLIDANMAWDEWTGEMRPPGVRLETAAETLIAAGSFDTERPSTFRDLYDRAVKSLGLS